MLGSVGWEGRDRRSRQCEDCCRATPSALPGNSLGAGIRTCRQDPKVPGRRLPMSRLRLGHSGLMTPWFLLTVAGAVPAWSRRTHRLPVSGPGPNVGGPQPLTLQRRVPRALGTIGVRPRRRQARRGGGYWSRSSWVMKRYPRADTRTATAAYCSKIQMPGRSLQARLKRHSLQFFKLFTSSTATGCRPVSGGAAGRGGPEREGTGRRRALAWDALDRLGASCAEKRRDRFFGISLGVNPRVMSETDGRTLAPELPTGGGKIFRSVRVRAAAGGHPVLCLPGLKVYHANIPGEAPDEVLPALPRRWMEFRQLFVM